MEPDPSHLPVKTESKTDNTLAGFTPLAQNQKLQSDRYYTVRPTAAPMATKTLTGIMRLDGKPKEKAARILHKHLIRIVDYLSAQSTLTVYPGSALLQLGFLDAFSRSELASLNAEDLDWQTEGIEIHIKQSKTDQLHIRTILRHLEWQCTTLRSTHPDEKLVKAIRHREWRYFSAHLSYQSYR